MTREAEQILGVFRTKMLGVGGMIHPAEFGDAIVWEDGGVKDEPVREALVHLFGNGYLIEWTAAFELTEKGSAYLYGVTTPKHEARVYRLGNKFIVTQVSLRGTPAEYVIDENRERHVAEDDDAGLASAIRDATKGHL